MRIDKDDVKILAVITLLIALMYAPLAIYVDVKYGKEYEPYGFGFQEVRR